MATICIFSRFEDISLLRLETPIVWLNVYRLFLSRGADIHIRNKDGNTPAMVVKVFLYRSYVALWQDVLSLISIALICSFQFMFVK